MLCTECGANLPDSAQFCPECGGGLSADASVPADASASPIARRRRKVISPLWFLLPLLLIAIVAAALTNGFGSPELQTMFSPWHTETISGRTVSVNSRAFASCKFDVPSGTTDVAVSGEFIAMGGPADGLEVYVFADNAFVTWKSGYDASNFYDSGKVTKSNISALLPPGAGSYYLVFDNRSSPRSAKTVHTDVTLRYKKWLPDWALYLKEKIGNLLDLN